MNNFAMLIDGEMAPGDAQSIEVINPADEQVVALAPAATREQVGAAVEAAATAFPGWRCTSIDKRREVLRSMADVIDSHAAELAELTVKEQGKAMWTAQFELQLACQFLRAGAETQIPSEVVADDDEHRVEIQYQPLGVAACIIPWNFPIALMMLKLPYALLAGCTVVLKPSPFTPLATLRLGELVRDIVPAGVLNIISGGDEIGPWLTARPEVAKISFTGSIETGKVILAGSARDLKRTSLELGGNDAAIVLPDADVARIAPDIFLSAFLNSGQTCISIKRLYVHESLYEPMVQALGEMATQTKIGNGLDPQTQMGPIQNRMQYQKVLSVLDEVIKSGARIVAGGKIPDGPGYFLPPTIVADVEEGCTLVDEETFGPILPVIRYSDIEDAIEQANRSVYGLGGSAWGEDTEAARAVAERLECGAIWVNQHTDLKPYAPIGGAKWSGIGAEIGTHGLIEFMQMQSINIKKN